jgi:hypothetical protein
MAGALDMDAFVAGELAADKVRSMRKVVCDVDNARVRSPRSIPRQPFETRLAAPLYPTNASFPLQKACNPKYDPKCVPELTKDEALCQYGQSGGKDRSEACRRVKEAKGK